MNSPLYVDLDGTFIKSDMLYECFITAFKQQPFIVFFCFIWLLSGRANLKQQLAQRALPIVNIKSIPLNTELFNYLTKQKQDGRKIVLATASNQAIAQAFTETYADIFDGFIASSATINFKGKRKLDQIKQQEQTFSYAGNASEDFVLFEHAEQSILVNPSTNARKLATNQQLTFRFDLAATAPTSKLWLSQLRLHQWLKNLLIFVPVFVSGQYLEQKQLLICFLAFLAFGLLASSTYIINDLLDLESDRLHPRKKNRPLAAANLSILSGLAVSFCLFVTSAVISITLGLTFSLVLVTYLILTLTYSFKIKRYFGMDVIALASLYTIRIFAGAAVIAVTVSFWLLSFSMFIFLSLALVKRCGELQGLAATDKQQVKGRDYNVTDINVLTSFGSASSLLAILMFCFYINNQALTDQYQQLTLLWLIIPIMGYWLIRMWVKTARGEMHDDPIVFSLKDKGSIVCIFAMVVIAGLAQLL